MAVEARSATERRRESRGRMRRRPQESSDAPALGRDADRGSRGMLVSAFLRDPTGDRRTAVSALPGRVHLALLPGEILLEPEFGAAGTAVGRGRHTRNSRRYVKSTGTDGRCATSRTAPITVSQNEERTATERLVATCGSSRHPPSGRLPVEHRGTFPRAVRYALDAVVRPYAQRRIRPPGRYISGFDGDVVFFGGLVECGDATRRFGRGTSFARTCDPTHRVAPRATTRDQ